MLKGQAKADYMREYMRKRRGSNIKPVLDPVRPTVRPIPGLKMDGKRIIGVNKRIPAPIQEGIPLYNPSIHGPGDRVMVKSPYSKKMVLTVIPMLDDDGNKYW